MPEIDPKFTEEYKFHCKNCALGNEGINCRLKYCATISPCERC